MTLSMNANHRVDTGPSSQGGQQPLVVTDRLTKRFTKTVGDKVFSFEALSSLNLQIDEGEFVAIVGPSGCGKTTLLRLIGGLTPPTSGQILINGNVVTGPGPERATVFQDFLLLPWRTCLANVEFGLELQGVAPEIREAKAREAIQLVGLEAWCDNYPNELSGGMQQRVGIARALAVNPQILLMDEPFGSLDAISRAQMQQELLRIFTKANMGKTVLFVTHSIDEALLLADRIIVMAKGGKMVEDVRLTFGRPRIQAQLLLNAEYIDVKRRLIDTLELGAQARAFNE